MTALAASPKADGHAIVAGGVAQPSKIGPNAILQVQSALVEATNHAQMGAIMHQAGLAHYLNQAPTDMVDECEVVRLHQAVRSTLPDDAALHVLTKAGEQTAAYILANRIPKRVQSVLKLLPAPLASPILLRAIARNAWTFTGSGSFAFEAHGQTRIKLTQCPACSMVYAPNQPCAYYIATIQGLFSALVHPRSTVREQLPAHADGSLRILHVSWA